MLRLRLLWSAALLLCVAAVPPLAARADAEADRLFNEALGDMKTAEFGVACPKLATSLSLEPKSGTQISLAFCLDKLGKKGAAWHHYREAARLARAENRADYVEKATKLASELEPKLAPLRVTIAPTPGLIAKVDDIMLDPSRMEIFVDVGPHLITAIAEGRTSFERRLEVPASGASIEIPPLEPATLTAPPRDLVRPPPPPLEQAPPPHEGRLQLQSLIAPGAVLASVGGASLITSFVLGGLVLGDKSTVESECDLEARTCTQAGLDAASGGETKSIAASVLFAVGAASTGLGVTFLFLGAASVSDALPPAAATLRVTTSGAGLVFAGDF